MKPPRLFSLTVLTVFGIVVLLPIFYMIFSPVWAADAMDPDAWSSLFERRQLSLAGNSLGLGLGVTGLCLTIGVPLAFLIQKTDLWGASFFRTVHIIPILIPPFIHAIVWNEINRWLKGTLLLSPDNLWSTIFVLTLAYHPFVTLVTISGLKAIDRNLEEASLLCHGKWKTLQHITLPLVAPHILAGATLVFILSIIDFGVPDIFRLNVYPIEIFVQYSAFYNEQAAAALSLPLIAVILLLLFMQKWYMRDRTYLQISGGQVRTIPYGLGAMRLPAFTFCALIFGLSSVVPLVKLLLTAGPISTYARVLSSSAGQIAYSFLLAVFGAFLALSLGLALAYLTERSKNATKIILALLLFLPFAIPPTTLGIGMINIWNRPWLDLVYGSSFIIVLAHVARFVPFSAITTVSGLKQLNPRLEEAAALTGSSWFRTISKIVLPLLSPTLLVGFFVVFILSFGELGTTLLIIPPGRETYPIKDYNLMHYGADRMVAALCLLLLALIFTFSGFFLILYRKLERSYL